MIWEECKEKRDRSYAAAMRARAHVERITLLGKDTSPMWSVYDTHMDKVREYDAMVLTPSEDVPLHERPSPKDYSDRVMASELDCKEARRRNGRNDTGLCQRCGDGPCQVYI